MAKMKGNYMKKQIILLSALVSLSATANCELSGDIETPETLQEQILCLQKQCKTELSSEEDEFDPREEQDLKSCIEKKLASIENERRLDREQRIDSLKTSIRSSEDLNLLIDLALIDSGSIDNIIEIIASNVRFWNEQTISNLKEKFYNEDLFFEYITTNYIPEEFHTSLALEFMVKNDSPKFKSYLLSYGKLVPSIMKLTVNRDIVELILNNLTAPSFSKEYLEYAKTLVLKDEYLNNRLIVILKNMVETRDNHNSFEQAFADVFADSHQGNIFPFYVILTDKLTLNVFSQQTINLDNQNINYLVNFYTKYSSAKLIRLLSILSKIDTSVFNYHLSYVINNFSNNIDVNGELAKFISENHTKIKEANIIDFLKLSTIDLTSDLNIFYISKIANNSLSEGEYFNYIKDLYLNNNQLDFLIYASYTLSTDKLKEVIELTKRQEISLLANINPELIKNLPAWKDITTECLSSNCSYLNDIYNIHHKEIYEIIFQQGRVSHTYKAIETIKSPSNTINFKKEEIENFIKILERRTPRHSYMRAKIQLKKILKSATRNINIIINNDISENIDSNTLSDIIKNLRASLPVANKNEIDKKALTNTLRTLEQRVANSPWSTTGVLLEEINTLISTQKIAISNKLVEKIKQQSILSALQHIYNKDYTSEWATNLIKAKIERHGNMVNQVKNVNTALYDAALLKYALASAKEDYLQQLSYEQINTLRDMISYHNELPHKLFLNEDSIPYEEILKDYFLISEDYFPTYRNTSVNMPLKCATAGGCVYHMKYNQNIGPLTSIQTTASAINFENTGLKVYKNRNISVIGMLTDVLFIDGSVDSDIVPDQRPPAANGVPALIGKRDRYQRVCTLRIKLWIGSKCINEKTYTITDEYVATKGVPPQDGLKGFTGANSAELSLNLQKSTMSRFGRIIFLNNTGKGGKGQIGGHWETQQHLGGSRAAGSGRTSELTVLGFGFSGDRPGNGRKVGLHEAIPGYKIMGSYGEDGQSGSFGEINLNDDSSIFDMLTIGKNP
jgi:hypothetical protein